MNKINLFVVATIGIMLSSCKENSQEITNNETEKKLPKIVKKTDSTSYDSLKDKFLITANSAGFFKIGDSWQNLAKSEYKYESIQEYGNCIDGCCDGGFLLGNKIIDDKYGKTIENQKITIGALIFDESASKNKHKSNSNVFYASSDNCQGWYWKDKINYIVVHSDSFKTKEGIGVGTTLKQVQEKFGKLSFDVGWIEEDMNALQINIKSYPNISFILDENDYKGNLGDITLKGDKNSLTISNFKQNTKIKRLILQKDN